MSGSHILTNRKIGSGLELVNCKIYNQEWIMVEYLLHYLYLNINPTESDALDNTVYSLCIKLTMHMHKPCSHALTMFINSHTRFHEAVLWELRSKRADSRWAGSINKWQVSLSINLEISFLNTLKQSLKFQKIRQFPRAQSESFRFLVVPSQHLLNLKMLNLCTDELIVCVLFLGSSATTLDGCIILYCVWI